MDLLNRTKRQIIDRFPNAGWMYAVDEDFVLPEYWEEEEEPTPEEIALATLFVAAGI